MSWWGKLVGGAFGFMLGGPLGALLGVALGHNFDKGMKSLPDDAAGVGDRERVQMAFFTATFAVMGRVAKADGRVSPEEIRMAETVMAEMSLDATKRKAAINLFHQGKSDQFDLDAVLQQFRRECHGRSTLIGMFIEIQLQAAYADGSLDPAEDRLLRYVCDGLGVSELDYRRLERMVRAERGFGGQAGGRGQGRTGAGSRPSLDDAYQVLGVQRDASDADVKRAYRRLLSQHHPDKLVSKGLPEEMMRVASQKTHEIRQAYEQIRESRGG
ncbi:MAG: co-chaperone DjlA [Gammaproteobacteria bacterium]|nr:co-chaperone DjlA [Gammaproteobacteria bacterium]MCP5317390.1 co-chaperone DjlA [Chromatiaceae bacterium]MCW5585343.1 co-chaperone DjlA [Chromatiales bacterium]MCB1818082.1 co-chaperone DjlA [Gammaproteobacteria bacterium]MCP5435901.1 co-chaperone DjlA [Chromatiaceae bacterium]